MAHSFGQARGAVQRKCTAPLMVRFGYELDGGPCVHPVCAGLVLPMPLLLSHSYPLFGNVVAGSCFSWPGGFLLSALPTQPAQGLPVALPLPLPFSDGEPSRVEQ